MTARLDWSYREIVCHFGYGIWLLSRVSHPRIDARLYKFNVEMKFGIFLSLDRDIMGPSFSRKPLLVYGQRYAP
jgi:hypothetical protein